MRKGIFAVFCAVLSMIQMVGAVNVSSIAEYSKLADDTEVTFSCRLAVLAQKGNKLFVTDGQRGTVLYAPIKAQLKHGDLLKEGFTAKKTTYDYAPELIQPDEKTIEKVQENVTIRPTKMRIENVTMDKVYTYARVIGYFDVVTKKFMAGDQEILLFNAFNKELPKESGTTTIDGIVMYYKRKDMMELYIM